MENRMRIKIVLILTLIFSFSSAFASTTNIKLTQHEQPYYPLKASYQQKEGTVEVAILFNQDGKVIDIDIIGGSEIKLFEEAVLYTVANRKVTPFTNQKVYRLEKTFYFGMPSKDHDLKTTKQSGTDTSKASPESFKAVRDKKKRLYKGYRQYIKRKHGSNGL
jgi:TonB family protein